MKRQKVQYENGCKKQGKSIKKIPDVDDKGIPRRIKENADRVNNVTDDSQNNQQIFCP